MISDTKQTSSESATEHDVGCRRMPPASHVRTAVTFDHATPEAFVGVRYARPLRSTIAGLPTRDKRQLCAHLGVHCWFRRPFGRPYVRSTWRATITFDHCGSEVKIPRWKFNHSKSRCQNTTFDVRPLQRRRSKCDLGHSIGRAEAAYSCGPC